MRILWSIVSRQNGFYHGTFPGGSPSEAFHEFVKASSFSQGVYTMDGRVTFTSPSKSAIVNEDSFSFTREAAKVYAIYCGAHFVVNANRFADVMVWVGERSFTASYNKGEDVMFIHVVPSS